MSTKNLSVADVATKKIRELTESEELKGWIPIDSNVFGTKKFDAEKIALKDAVQAAMSNLNNKIETETNARVTLGTRVSSLETKLRGALVFKESLTVSQISNLSLDAVEPGFMYTASNAGTIQYTLEGTPKTLTVEAYDEVAWSETGWYIVGRDHEVDLSEYTKTANLAAVALSNSYNDLDNKPEIPPAQVNADWNASEGKAVILNKPTLAALALSGDWADILNKPNFHEVATSGDYRQLNNKPTIGTGVITLQVNGTTADSFSANASDNKIINLQIAVPTKTSDLTNDSGFITASALPTKVSDLTNDSGFITASDIPTIPSKTSDLQNDSDFITLSDIPTATVYDDGLMSHEDHSKLQGIEAGAQVNVKPDWNAAAGSDAEILNKPAIPNGYTTKRNVNYTQGASNTVTYNANVDEYSVLADVPAGTTGVVINFVTPGVVPNDRLIEAAFEIKISTSGLSVNIGFTRNGDRVSEVINMPVDLTVTDKIFGVLINNSVFIGETLKISE